MIYVVPDLMRRSLPALAIRVSFLADHNSAFATGARQWPRNTAAVPSRIHVVQTRYEPGLMGDAGKSASRWMQEMMNRRIERDGGGRERERSKGRLEARGTKQRDRPGEPGDGLEHRGRSIGDKIRAQRTKHGRRDQSAEREAQGTDRLGKARGTKHVGRPVSRGSNQVLATRADAPLNAAQRTQDGEPCHSMRGCVAQRDHAATVEGGLVDATQMRPGSSNGWTDAASGDAAPTQNTVGPNCLWPRRFPATAVAVFCYRLWRRQQSWQP